MPAIVQEKKNAINAQENLPGIAAKGKDV